MSDEIEGLKAQLTAALAKIAAFETEMAPLRARVKDAPDPDTIRRAIQREFTNNPSAALKKYGIPQDHLTKVLVAEALGDQAPPELRILAQMGPQVSSAQEMANELAALRQRVESSEKASRRQTLRESLKTLAEDKKAHPHLSAALGTGLFDKDIESHEGSAADLAKALNDRLAATAKALGVPQPDSQDTGSEPVKSTQDTAPVTKVGGPPPIQQRARTAGFSEDDRQSLRDEIVRNAEKGVYDNPAHQYRPR